MIHAFFVAVTRANAAGFPSCDSSEVDWVWAKRFTLTSIAFFDSRLHVMNSAMERRDVVGAFHGRALAAFLRQ
jgi:hypothetical protein